MYGTYCRLNVHVGASNIEVIRAARRRLMSYSLDRQHRAERHRFFRQMLAYHRADGALYRRGQMLACHRKERAMRKRMANQ